MSSAIKSSKQIKYYKAISPSVRFLEPPESKVVKIKRTEIPRFVNMP